MSILRIVRDEAAGAWRSLRYDLARRGTEAPRPHGGYAYPGYDPDTENLSGYARPPRRLLAAGAFGVLALVGAAGTYVTVASSLDSVLNTDAAAPRGAPEIPGVPAPSPSPGPALPPAAAASEAAARAWTSAASRPMPRGAATTATATARGVAPVASGPGRRTVEAAPTPDVPPLTGTPGSAPAAGSPGPAHPGLPVPTPTSPDYPGHWDGDEDEPDQIPDWPDWPEHPDFPTAPPEIPESMTPTPGVDATGPASAEPTGDAPNTPASSHNPGNTGNPGTNAVGDTGY
ncbi:hypothetical protein [Catenuloplanes atrovinosus]|uniref:Uncharacterized protein n=1 Tax=Catenuloplanes atrovinosus TaxID=137266 RepID=A0AAE3YRC6_9ACTN|nr:hypothetical protein [Catenuloplanes atrovinosus]MDR7278210.1 hypothetical protein [Catenuloplanes atrovinosus]